MYYRKTLSNGIRVIGERIPHFRSISIGVWIGAGSCWETPENNGISHFLEHMFFKGTTNRSASEIASAIDSVGGQLNAFTAKECTCLYAKVMDEHIGLAVDVLSDMLINSAFDPTELAKELGVVNEELLMSEDSPEDMTHDLMAKAYFGQHPLGMTILGTKESLATFNRQTILDYIEKMYIPSNIVIAVAGGFDESSLGDMLEEYFGKMKATRACLGCGCLRVHETSKCSLTLEKDIEQMNLSIGFPGIAQSSDDITAMLIFNNLFGGAMSSRLFQKLREENGLVYTVYSYPSSYQNQGLFSIYAATKPEQAEQAARIIIEETENVKKTITQEEFNNAREQLKGNYFLGLESTSSRMSTLGKGELLLNKVYTPDQVVQRINAVTLDKVKEIMDRIFIPEKMCTAMVGRINKVGNIF